MQPRRPPRCIPPRTLRAELASVSCGPPTTVLAANIRAAPPRARLAPPGEVRHATVRVLRPLPLGRRAAVRRRRTVSSGAARGGCRAARHHCGHAPLAPDTLVPAVRPAVDADRTGWVRGAAPRIPRRRAGP